MPEPPLYRPIGLPFIELQSVDSTNNYALAELHAGLAQHGQVYFTHEQVAGKGQRGKIWKADKDANILISVVIDPHKLAPEQQFQLSACISVAILEFFTKYAGDATRIKWPNDLYWHDRKAGGILIENILRGQSTWRWAVAGIGINLNQPSFPEELKNPVSLKQITGRDFEPVAMAKELCGALEKHYNLLINNGFEEISSRYQELLYRRGELVRFRKGNIVFDAKILGVSTIGRLQTESAGVVEDHDFGELEWLIG